MALYNFNDCLGQTDEEWGDRWAHVWDLEREEIVWEDGKHLQVLDN